MGIFPSVPLVSFGLPPTISCSAAANGIIAVVNAKASVVNLSFGSPGQCFTLFRTVEGAYGAGTLVVAAAGNEAQEGNAPNYPAAWPHVLSVAAIGQTLAPASFSNSNAAVDIAAPGEAVPVDTPVALDTDGTPDGVRVDTGTSFASPIVAGAAAWVWSARPSPANGQVADVLRESASDVNTPGLRHADRLRRREHLERADRADAGERPARAQRRRHVHRRDLVPRPRPVHLARRARPPLRASVDVVEDPVDTYRVQVPPAAARAWCCARRSATPTCSPFPGTRKTLAGTPLARSEKNGRATDAVTLHNPSGVPRRFYVAIVSASKTSLNSSYSLSFSTRR